MSDLSGAIEKIDVEWLVSREGLRYKESYGRSGRQLNLQQCPFCGKKEYRVYVNAETGVGNCFSGSCPQKTWNKWNFMRGVLGLEGRQLANAVIELAREQGWRPKIATNTLGLQDLNTLDLPEGCVPAWEMDPIPEYLGKRGITHELAEYFGLYYSENAVWRFMDPRGFEGKQDYSNRVILPVFDLDGTMVSFQGRDVTGTHETRYLFPPGFAAAGAYLYNGQNVLPTTTHVVISEGVFDVIAVKRALLSDKETEDYVPIGTFGMHLSSGNPSGDDQMGRLRKLKREGALTSVTFLWDGERKAAAGAVQAALQLSALGFKAKIGFVPDGKDPGNTRADLIVKAIKEALPCRNKLEALKVVQHAKRIYKTE